MKTNEVFALDEWISEQKQWIMSADPTVADIRAKVETMLGFKCPPDPIKSCMERHGIPRRRSKADAQRMMLEQQVDELTELVFDLVAHGNVPPAMLLKFRERRTNLNARVTDYLKRYEHKETAG